MRYLQVGILVALIAVAVLLGLNLMKDGSAAEPEAIPSAAAVEVPAAEPATTPEASPETAVGPTASANAGGTAKPEAPATPAATEPKLADKPAATERQKPAVVAGNSRKPSPASSATVPASKPAREPGSQTGSVRVDPPASQPDLRSLPPAPAASAPVTTAANTERYELMRPESETVAATHPAPPAPPRTITIPSGTILTIRTVQTLSSRSNATGDTFSGTLDQPLVFDDLVIAERGSRVEGKVVEVTESGRVKGVAQIAVQLQKINTSDGQTIAVQTQSFTMEAEKTTKSDATKVGIATGIGAALGAIFGGGKGAAIGAAAGAGAGGGAVLATKGKPAEIPSESRINFRLDRPLTITEKINH